MASRKTAAPTDKPASPRKKAATASTTTTARKAPARRAAGAGEGTTARKTTRTAAGGGARKAPARKAPAKAEVAAKKAPVRKKPEPAEAGAAFEAAKIAAQACLDKKAENVVILDVRGLTSYADYFVVASGSSDRQVTAIADNVEETMKKAGNRPIGMEGYTRGHWVLIDFGDVVAHVFYEEARGFYDIEGLWADAVRIPVE